MNLALSAATPTAVPASILTLSPAFAVEYGYIESVIVNQMAYWVERSRHIIDGVPWVYNTIAQWHKQFPFFSERTIRRAIRHLEHLGFIQSDRKDAHWWNQRKWYSVDQKRLKPYLLPNRPNVSDRSGLSDRINNKDLSIEKIKETNTGLTAPNPVDPPAHPVTEVERKVNKGATELQPLQTGDGLNPENPEIKPIRAPQPTPQVKPKPKPKQILDSPAQTIAPPPVEIPVEIEAQIVATIAPVPLHRNLRKQVLQAQIYVIQDALALVNQQKATGKVKNPAGFLVKAIQNQWKPNQPDPSPPPLPEDFNEWFELARQSGLVIASMLIDGVLCIRTTAEKWEPYEDFRSAFSLPWLRRSLHGQSLPPPL